MRSILYGLVLGLTSLAAALSAAGNTLLVVIEDEADKAKYSTFWSDLTSRGFQLTYSTPKDTSLGLFHLGEPAYSHLLLLPPKSKGFGPNLTPKLIIEFVNAGSNVLLALSGDSSVPSAISSLLLELDITLPSDRTSLVVDHFNYDTKSASEQHDVLLLPSGSSGKKGIKDYFGVEGLVALPRAVGQVLGNESPLLSSIVKAPATAYTYSPKSDDTEADDLFATGSQISLVTAFQALNNARFTVLGSVAALEDKWFDASVQAATAGAKASKSSNRAFAEKLSAWTFKEAGVIKAGIVTHSLNETGQKTTDITKAGVELNPTIYRIKNDVYYSIAISEWSGTNWTPFTPAAGDAVQLDFSMLSPFHRLNLIPSQQTANATIFTQTFKLPDQHGIFNFYVNYQRPFVTSVEEKRTVTVRHFAHDEWPRSYVISGAWPWISGIWVTVVGWLVFVGLWLYSKPAQPKQDLKATKSDRSTRTSAAEHNMATMATPLHSISAATQTVDKSCPLPVLHLTAEGPKESRLLLLPTELLTQIIEYVFEDSSIGPVTHMPNGIAVLNSSYTASSKLWPLLACRQLYYDHQFLALAYTSFSITSPFANIDARLISLAPSLQSAIRSLTFVADDRHFRMLIAWGNCPFDMPNLQLDTLAIVLLSSSRWHFLFDHTRDLIQLLRRLHNLKRLVFVRNNASVKGSFKTWCNRLIGLILKIDHEQRYLVDPPNLEQVWWSWEYDAKAQTFTLEAAEARPLMGEDEYMRRSLGLMETLRVSVESEEWNPDPRSRVMYY
nr:hypothetical protein B0A51_05479 [Rachicladosporium sp. CCFEE 5018]